MTVGTTTTPRSMEPVDPRETAAPVDPPRVEIDLTDRLLRAAIDEFVAKGLDRAGVAAIARRAGVTTGAIYSRWRGKQEMMVDALDEVMSHHLATLLTAQTNPSAPEILAALGEDLVDPDADRAADAILLEAFGAARRDPEFAAMLQRRLIDQEGRLALVIEDGKLTGVIDPALSTDAIVALCHSIGFGFTLLRTVDRPVPAADDWRTLIGRLIASAAPSFNPSTPDRPLNQETTL